MQEEHPSLQHHLRVMWCPGKGWRLEGGLDDDEENVEGLGTFFRDTVLEL